MANHELVGIDTTFEARVAAEKPGVRQRALAVQALIQLTESIDKIQLDEAVERLRRRPAKEAKIAARALTEVLAIIRPADDEALDTEESAELAREVDSVFDSTERTLFDTVDGVFELEERVVAPEEPAQEEVTSEEPQIQAEESAVQEEEAGESTTPEIETDTVDEEVSEQQPRLLAPHVRKWLEGQIDDDIDTLTEEDIPEILEKLKAAYGPISSKTKIDLDQLVFLRLTGMSTKDIVEQNIGVGSAESAQQTLTNYRKKILSQKAQPLQESSAEAPLVDESIQQAPVVPAHPVPKPPKNRAALRNVLTDPAPQVQEAEVSEEVEASEPNGAVEAEVVTEAEVQVADEIESPEIEEPVTASVDKEPEEDYFHVLLDATEHPNNYTREEWKRNAEAYIREHTNQILSPDQVDALWTHLHDAGDERYRQAPAEYQTAIESLRSYFTAATKETHTDLLVNELSALRMLFNPSAGRKHLDDIHKMLVKKDPKITPMLAERILTAGMVKILPNE